MAFVSIDGTRDLERVLKHLASEGSSRVQAASLRGAVAPLKKQIRNQVNGASLSAAMKRAARLTIGSSVKKVRGTKQYGAKAGLGVGKPTKAKKTKAAERAKAGRGVGLSATNIHWATLGTTERHTKSGHRTGTMPAFLAGLVPKAAMAAKTAMVAEAASRAKVALKKEAQKRR